MWGALMVISGSLIELWDVEREANVRALSGHKRKRQEAVKGGQDWAGNTPSQKDRADLLNRGLEEAHHPSGRRRTPSFPRIPPQLLILGVVGHRDTDRGQFLMAAAGTPCGLSAIPMATISGTSSNSQLLLKHSANESSRWQGLHRFPSLYFPLNTAQA